ncbi:hypothetical protein HY946_00385 [Candidatus Gottesmanbacteria bacterium]|nr:hypothetical protein [Candidatus Gottesmanbacteria bacterium]
MKIQDLGFLMLLFLVLWVRNERLSVWLGLLCLVLAIPLFALWIFFTAQRLVAYAAAFFALSVIWQVGLIRQIKRGRER